MRAGDASTRAKETTTGRRAERFIYFRSGGVKGSPAGAAVEVGVEAIGRAGLASATAGRAVGGGGGRLPFAEAFASGGAGVTDGAGATDGAGVADGAELVTLAVALVSAARS